MRLDTRLQEKERNLLLNRVEGPNDNGNRPGPRESCYCGQCSLITERMKLLRTTLVFTSAETPVTQRSENHSAVEIISQDFELRI